MKWSNVREYVKAFKGLLRGEQVEWEGGVMQMMHPAGDGSPRPIEVPFVIAAAGPKGIAVAHELGDGVLAAMVPIGGLKTCVVLTLGTVLDEGEDAGSARAIAAAGHGAAVAFHAALERGQPGRIPNGEAWIAAYDAVPKRVRHRTARSASDRGQRARSPLRHRALLAQLGLALNRAGWRAPRRSARSAGCDRNRVPARRPRYPTRLEAFAKAVRG